MAWDLSKCIKEFKKNSEGGVLTEAIEANLEFFIQLRNKIAHKYIDKRDLDSIMFGELQSLLYNYETFVTNIFGESFSMQENISFALQFSTLRTDEQRIANKTILSKEFTDIKKFIEKYKGNLSQDILDSKDYRINVLLVPRVSNTKAHDVAIEHVDPNSEEHSKIIEVLTKQKTHLVEAHNVNRYLPGKVVEEVRERFKEENFTLYQHSALVKMIKVKPQTKSDAPFETKTKFCLYDEAHRNYIYTEDWINLIGKVLTKHSKDEINSLFKKGEILNEEDFAE